MGSEPLTEETLTKWEKDNLGQTHGPLDGPHSGPSRMGKLFAELRHLREENATMREETEASSAVNASLFEEIKELREENERLKIKEIDLQSANRGFQRRLAGSIPKAAVAAHLQNIEDGELADVAISFPEAARALEALQSLLSSTYTAKQVVEVDELFCAICKGSGGEGECPDCNGTGWPADHPDDVIEAHAFPVYVREEG